MKMPKKMIVSLGVMIAAVACIVSVPNVTQADPTNAVVAVTHPEGNAKYNENPAPALTGNASAAHDKFISKDKAIEKANIQKDAKVSSVELVTWEKHVKDNVQGGSGGTEVAKDRMVWVIKADYPNGASTKAGYFENAQRVISFDAESGRLLSVMTTGDLKEVKAPWNAKSH